MNGKVGAGKIRGRTRGFRGSEIRDEWVSFGRNGVRFGK